MCRSEKWALARVLLDRFLISGVTLSPSLPRYFSGWVCWKRSQQSCKVDANWETGQVLILFLIQILRTSMASSLPIPPLRGSQEGLPTQHLLK